MIIIKPIDTVELRELCTDCGLCYTPQLFAWSAFDSTVKIGYAIADLSLHEIIALKCADSNVMDGLIKKAADFCFCAGIEKVYCNLYELSEPLKAAGFMPDGRALSLTIDGVRRACKE